MTIKLTKPQRGFLAEAVRDGSVSCIESYPPARRLLSLGLVISRDGKFGSRRLYPTDAGRHALSAADGSKT